MMSPYKKTSAKSHNFLNTLNIFSFDRRTIAEGLGKQNYSKLMIIFKKTKQCISSHTDLGFKITNPNEIGKLMPKNRFDAEEEGMDIIIDCTGVPGNIG